MVLTLEKQVRIVRKTVNNNEQLARGVTNSVLLVKLLVSTFQNIEIILSYCCFIKYIIFFCSTICKTFNVHSTLEVGIIPFYS